MGKRGRHRDGLQKKEHLVVDGSPRIYAGEGALQRSGKSFPSDLRFSAGDSEEARSVYGSRLSCLISGHDFSRAVND